VRTAQVKSGEQTMQCPTELAVGMKGTEGES